VFEPVNRHLKYGPEWRFVGTGTNLKSAALTILELLSLSAQKFTGSRDPDHAPVFICFHSGVMSGLSVAACVSNLKFVPLAVLEHWHLSPRKFKGSRDPGHAPFYPLLTFGGWRPPSDVDGTMYRYNWSRDNAREVFQHSH